MDIGRGDVVKADDNLDWRVERVGPGDSIVLYSMDGRTQRFVTASQITANYSFLQRCCDHDLAALVSLTPAEREEFEARTWRQFFSRHIRLADCQATRTILTDSLNGDFISLAALEQSFAKLRDKLPTRQL